MNLLSYVSNKPLVILDPSGQCGIKPRCEIDGKITITPNPPKWKVSSRPTLMAIAEFEFTAKFKNDPATGAECGCCEVRLFIKWDEAFSKSSPLGKPHGGFEEPEDKIDTWYEDRNESDSLRYGYRDKYGDGKYGNAFTDPDAESGCSYRGWDGPGADRKTLIGLHGKFIFKVKVVDVCNPNWRENGTPFDNSIAESEEIIVDFDQQPFAR